MKIENKRTRAVLKSMTKPPRDLADKFNFIRTDKAVFAEEKQVTDPLESKILGESKAKAVPKAKGESKAKAVAVANS